MNPGSRYYEVGTAELKNADGQVIVYLKRRFIAQPADFAAISVHEVKQGERLDHITARYLSEPEQFWRVCDANAALRPEELEEVGRKIRITLPAGVPAPTVNQ